MVAALFRKIARKRARQAAPPAPPLQLCRSEDAGLVVVAQAVPPARLN
jgi:hypothetical protein